MKESHENFVDLKGFTTTIGVEQMIEFSYTGNIKITFDTIISLLDAASYFQIKQALTLINDYLIENCTEKNCVNILELADRFSLNQIKQYLAKNFEYYIKKAEKATDEEEEIADEPDYEKIKPEDFGLACLRGMGWYKREMNAEIQFLKHQLCEIKQV